ncbi:hypothetical protein BGZ60DRAFT_519845 [Tricladium varicosporioides]|nr:hypothetical protein BGZ60DRAFT_519845 [Hymenoscyphus varicosporioides]
MDEHNQAYWHEYENWNFSQYGDVQGVENEAEEYEPDEWKTIGAEAGTPVVAQLSIYDSSESPEPYDGMRWPDGEQGTTGTAPDGFGPTKGQNTIADKLQLEEWHLASTLTSNTKWPTETDDANEPNINQPENDNFDEGSVISGRSTAPSLMTLKSVFSNNESVSSKSSMDEPQEIAAIDRLVAIFLEDDAIVTLFSEAFHIRQKERVERNISSSAKAVAFVRSRARNAAHIICNNLKGEVGSDERAGMIQPDEDDSDSGDSDEIEGPDEDDLVDEESESRDPEDDLQPLKLFINTSVAIVQFRERLRAFVHPQGVPRPFFHEQLPKMKDENLESPDNTKTGDNARAVSQPRYSQEGQTCVSSVSRPALDEGKIRIEWKCRCGKIIWDDFLELKPGAAARLAEHLSGEARSQPQKKGSKFTSTAMAISGILQKLRGLIPGMKNGQTAGLPLHTTSNTASNGSGRPQAHTDLGTNSGMNGSLSSHAKLASNQPVDSLWLLLCYSKGRYSTRLLQLDLTSENAVCDKSLFHVMRANYFNMKSFWHRHFSLRVLAGIKFVRFEMYKSELVDIRKENNIPPSGNTEYMYEPAPPELILQIGENHMMHCFNHPDDTEDEQVCLTRFPKKIKEKLRCSKGAHPGWGLQFVEGWDIKKTWLLAFGVGSLLLGILWTYFKHSIQDAFTMSAYLIAFGTVTIGTVQAVLVM